MAKENTKAVIVENADDDKQEPYYGSTIMVWIRPKPGKYGEIKINIGEAKKSIMVPSSFFQDLMDVISMVAEKIQEVNEKKEPDEG